MRARARWRRAAPRSCSRRAARTGSTRSSATSMTPAAAAQQGPRHVADLINISSVAGRVARSGSGVYNLTKHGVGAFSESARQEFAGRHVRISLVEPGATATELSGHNRPEVLESIKSNFSGVERMQAEDIADAISYIVTRPRHVAVNELLIRPTEQER